MMQLGMNSARGVCRRRVPGWRRSVPGAVVLAWCGTVGASEPGGAGAGPEEPPGDPLITLGQGDDEEFADAVGRLGLSDLLVTSVSKREEDLFRAAAAVSVITDEEVRRSGARTLAEALRLSPGIEYGQVSSSQTAVSARGFNDRFTNRFLVLVDGRSVYNGIFGGTYWSDQDVLLEDLEQIEVIRGSGGTLWGANAMNGVVNILTKDASDTLGTFVTGGLGTEENFFAVRHGFEVGNRGHARVYMKFDDFDSLALGGGQAPDAWHTYRGGFRYDLDHIDNHVTLQGDVYYGERGNAQIEPIYVMPYTRQIPDDVDSYGGNILGRWTRTLANESELKVQSYWDYWRRDSDVFDLSTHTFDIEGQYSFQLGRRHHIVTGAGYRLRELKSGKNDGNFIFMPPSLSLNLYNVFVHDEITLMEDYLKLIVGAKLEYNDFTHAEFQPNVRMVVTPSKDLTIWGSVSKSVRNPTYVHNYLTAHQAPIFMGGMPIFPVFRGNTDIESEEQVSWEAGIRYAINEDVAVDVATYYSNYTDLDGSVVSAPAFVPLPMPHLELPVTTRSIGSVDTFGIEGTVEWQINDWWKVRGAYTYFDFMNQENVQFDNGGTPQHQFFIRSSWDLPGDVEFDAWLRHRSKIDFLDVEGATDLDLRLSWQANENLELSIVGQNLLFGERRDYGIPPLRISAPIGSVERSIYGQATFRF